MCFNSNDKIDKRKNGTIRPIDTRPAAPIVGCTFSQLEVTSSAVLEREQNFFSAVKRRYFNERVFVALEAKETSVKQGR